MIDIRTIFPEMEDDINIYGTLSQILTMEQFKQLEKNGNIVEWGCDCSNVSHLRLQGIFTLEDVKNKINEICKKEE